MIESLNKVEKDKNSKAISMQALYEKLFYIFKINLVLISLLIIFFLILIVGVPERGIILQPFESNEKNLSSLFISNHLCYELQNIKKINNYDIENPENKSETGIIPSIELPGSSLEYSISGLGEIGAEGTSLSLGHLILSLKQFIGTSSPKLTGSIQRSKYDLRIIAILNDPNISGGIMAWEITENFSADNDMNGEKILIMMQDLAFQIVSSLINENDRTNSDKFPKTWEALKYLTLSRKAYLSYTATSNITHLDESRDFALRAKKSEPRYSEMSILFSILGFSYLEQSNYLEAERLFGDAIELDDSYPDAWNGLGIVRLFQNRNKSAIYAFDQINLKKRTADSWYNIGLAHYKLENYPESIKAYDKSIDKDPTNADAWNNKGTAHYKLGEFKESIQAYDQAIELNSTDAYLWYNKGIVLDKIEKNNDSIQALYRAIELDPNYIDAWMAIGKVSFEIGDYHGATDAYIKVNELNISNREPSNQISGVSHITSG